MAGFQICPKKKTRGPSLNCPKPRLNDCARYERVFRADGTPPFVLRNTLLVGRYYLFTTVPRGKYLFLFTSPLASSIHIFSAFSVCLICSWSGWTDFLKLWTQTSNYYITSPVKLRVLNRFVAACTKQKRVSLLLLLLNAYNNNRGTSTIILGPSSPNIRPRYEIRDYFQRLLDGPARIYRR